jgi:hypothetical protein
MTKHNRRLDDDDETNDHRVLRDGEFFRVPMMLMDGSPNGDLSQVQRAVALDAMQRDELASYRFGLNDGAAMHRPGYRHDFVDTNRDVKAKAYAEVDRAQTNAWLSNDAEPSDARKGNDREIPLRQITGDARKDAYLSYQEDLSDSWRGAQ